MDRETEHPMRTETFELKHCNQYRVAYSAFCPTMMRSTSGLWG
jgi:hypothetical protein